MGIVWNCPYRPSSYAGTPTTMETSKWVTRIALDSRQFHQFHVASTMLSHPTNMVCLFKQEAGEIGRRLVLTAPYFGWTLWQYWAYTHAANIESMLQMVKEIKQTNMYIQKHTYIVIHSEIPNEQIQANFINLRNSRGKQRVPQPPPKHLRGRLRIVQFSWTPPATEFWISNHWENKDMSWKHNYHGYIPINIYICIYWIQYMMYIYISKYIYICIHRM